MQFPFSPLLTLTSSCANPHGLHTTLESRTADGSIRDPAAAPRVARRLQPPRRMATSKKSPGRRRASGKRAPSTRRWSKEVTERSNALDLEAGVFTQSDPESVARSLKRSADRSAGSRVIPTDPRCRCSRSTSIAQGRSSRALSARASRRRRPSYAASTTSPRAAYSSAVPSSLTSSVSGSSLSTVPSGTRRTNELQGLSLSTKVRSASQLGRSS